MPAVAFSLGDGASSHPLLPAGGGGAHGEGHRRTAGPSTMQGRWTCHEIKEQRLSGLAACL